MANKNLRKARLANIDIDEVSFVDKAANKRKFTFVKRDTSTTPADEERKGENLELLKRFKKDKDVIKAVEGIDSHLTALKTKLEKALEADDLSDEDREMLLAKKEEFDLMREDIEEQFEHLFLDKTEKASKAADDEEEADEEESEETEEEEVMPPKGKKGKKPNFKKSEESTDEKDSDDDESEEDADVTTETTVVKEDDADEEDTDEDDAEDEANDDDEELDPEEEKLLKSITEVASDIKKTNDEIKAGLLSK